MLLASHFLWKVEVMMLEEGSLPPLGVDPSGKAELIIPWRPHCKVESLQWTKKLIEGRLEVRPKDDEARLGPLCGYSLSRRR